MATIKGTLGADLKEGGDQNDFIDGVGGHGDTLLGGLGDDTIVYRGGVGAILDGGAGENDTLVVLGAVGSKIDLKGTAFAMDLNGDGLFDPATEVFLTQTLGLGRTTNFENIDLAKAEIDGTSDPAGFFNGFDVKGTDGANRIVGSRFGDRIDARGGADVVIAGAGNDVVEYDVGDATIDGGAGTDRLEVSGEADVVLNLGGRDQDPGAAVVRGFEDVLALGLSGKLNATGSKGANEIQGGSNDDTVLGGAGNDILFGSLGKDSLDGGTGNDTITGGKDADTILGGLGLDRVEGIELTDATVDGGGGSDMLVLGNIKRLDNATPLLEIDLSKADNQFVAIPDDGTVVVRGFEAIDGSAMKDPLQVRGSLAANTLIGGAGDDILEAVGGGDVLEGGGGNDIIVANGTARRIDGGKGDADFLVLTLGATIDLSNETDQFTQRGSKTVMTGIESVDASSAVKGSLNIKGSDGKNVIIGTASNDTIDGLGGKDVLIGGAGDDRITYNDKAVSIDGGEGAKDTLVVLDGQGQFRFDLSAADQDNVGSTAAAGTEVTGFENIDASKSVKEITVTLSDVANLVQGSAFADAIGKSGEGDVVLAGDGSDLVDYSIKAKTLDGGKGTEDLLVILDSADAFDGKFTIDLLLADQVKGGGVTKGFEGVAAGLVDVAVTARGSNGANLLAGGFAADLLEGRKGNDTLNGGGGADTLNGGDGDDKLVLLDGDIASGGRGKDTFDFNVAQLDAARIVDFKVTDGDRIDLSGIDAIEGGADDDFVFILDQVTTGPFTGFGQLRATVDPDGNLKIEGNTDDDLTDAEFSFTLVGVLSIRVEDFVL